MPRPTWPGEFTRHGFIDLNVTSRGGNSDGCARWDDVAQKWRWWSTAGRTPPSDRTSIVYSETEDPDGHNDWSPIRTGRDFNVCVGHGLPGTPSGSGVEVFCPVRFAEATDTTDEVWWGYWLRKPGLGFEDRSEGDYKAFQCGYSSDPSLFANSDHFLEPSRQWEMPYVEVRGEPGHEPRLFQDGGLTEIAARMENGAVRIWYLAVGKTAVPRRAGTRNIVETTFTRRVGAAVSTNGKIVNWKSPEPVYDARDLKQVLQIDVTPWPEEYGGGWVLAYVPGRQCVNLAWSKDGLSDWIECPDNPVLVHPKGMFDGNLGGPSIEFGPDGKLHIYCHEGPNHWTNGGAMWHDVGFSHFSAKF